MRLSRLTPYAAAVALLALAPGALAAPRACKLVTDPAGDTRHTGNTSTPVTDDVYDSTDLDVVSADIATNAKNLTAVVRTKTLRAVDPDSPAGRAWEMLFVVGEQRYAIVAFARPDGYGGMVYRETADYRQGENGATSGEGIGRAKVVFDYKKAEVRITAPLSHFAAHTAIDKGRPIYDLEVWSFNHYGSSGTYQELPNGWVADIGGGGASSSLDSARSKKYYVAGSPSCVAVPR